MTRDLGNEDYYEMPDAPPFGREEEAVLVNQMKKVRNKVIDLLPFKIGQKIEVKNKEGKFVEIKNTKSAIKATIVGVMFGPERGLFTYLFTYIIKDKDKDGNDKDKKAKGSFSRVLPAKIQKSRQYAKVIAEYENERHRFMLRYSFAVKKIASNLCKQCHRGMGHNDLCQEGSIGIINSVDKWPPFLGAKDKRARILTSIQVAVHNAICRFLDDHGREIKVPSYKIEQITVRLKADNILYGKLVKKKDEQLCGETHCKVCSNLHKSACRRKRPGQFELSIQKLLIKIYEIKGTPKEQKEQLKEVATKIDGKSLRDFAIETGRYREVAEAVKLDVSSIISILESVVSIDMPLNNDNEGTIADLMPHEDYDSNRQVFLRENLEKALDHIAPRSANILRDCFFGGLSIREIAAKYKKSDGTSISTKRASELKEKAINQIKANSAAMNILIHKVVGR